jgi:hypothetical protein
MQTKPQKRALGPNDTGTVATNVSTPARMRPDHAAHHGRSTPRDAATRRNDARMQAQTGASMDYQMGFTSGPSN